MPEGMYGQYYGGL